MRRILIVVVAEILQTEAAVLVRTALEPLLAIGRLLIAAYLT